MPAPGAPTEVPGGCSGSGSSSRLGSEPGLPTLTPRGCAGFTSKPCVPGGCLSSGGDSPVHGPAPAAPLPPARRGAFLAKLFLPNNAELLNLLPVSKPGTKSLFFKEAAICSAPAARWTRSAALGRGLRPCWVQHDAGAALPQLPAFLGLCPPSHTPQQWSCSSLTVPTRPPAPHLCAEITGTLPCARPCSQLGAWPQSPCCECPPSPCSRISPNPSHRWGLCRGGAGWVWSCLFALPAAGLFLLSPGTQRPAGRAACQ